MELTSVYCSVVCPLVQLAEIRSPPLVSVDKCLANSVDIKRWIEGSPRRELVDLSLRLCHEVHNVFLRNAARRRGAIFGRSAATCWDTHLV